ncbi:unnamed protein product, partial [Brassica rapa subsp. narinosa]
MGITKAPVRCLFVVILAVLLSNHNVQRSKNPRMTNVLVLCVRIHIHGFSVDVTVLQLVTQVVETVLLVL